MTPERKYFALLHRDFNYVTRPVGYGTTTVRLADNARTSTQGFVLECESVYYQKVAPVDKQLGSQRQLQVPEPPGCLGHSRPPFISLSAGC